MIGSHLKVLGFKWDPIIKSWYIDKNKFTKDIYEKSKKVRYANNTSIGTVYYYYVYYKIYNEEGKYLIAVANCMKRIERDKFIKEAENELFKDNIKLNEDINYLKSLNKNDDIDDTDDIFRGEKSYFGGSYSHDSYVSRSGFWWK